MYNDVTGIILAGGKSTRMGENKSFLKIGSETVVERVVNLMKSLFSNVMIVTNTPGEYEFPGVPVHKDIFEYRGPLAGIHSGLKHSKTDRNFVISVDMPLMTGNMIRYITDFETVQPVTVCRADGFIQQLAGRYSRDVLPVAENILKEHQQEIRAEKQAKRKCAVLTMLDKTGAEIIDASNLDFYEPGMFYNMNRPEDYKFILSRLENN